MQEALQTTMQNLVGIVRSQAEMEQALHELESLKRRAEQVCVNGNREYNPGWHTALDLRHLMIISEEFSEWDERARRIDLLGLDRQGNLVVIELKRGEDGGHMELQALRYAAMVSSMDLDGVVRTYAKFLKTQGEACEKASEKIKEFLTSKNYVVTDCGPEVFDPIDDYPDFISRVAENVSRNHEAKGIVLGRTGEGEAGRAPGFAGFVFRWGERPRQLVDALCRS